VWSVVSLCWPLRVASISQTRATRVNVVRMTTYQLQNEVMTLLLGFFCGVSGIGCIIGKGQVGSFVKAALALAVVGPENQPDESNKHHQCAQAAQHSNFHNCYRLFLIDVPRTCR